jgi:hypothetical protein
MKLRRFEILLPLYYNDGRLVEMEKFMATNRELLNRFEALTTDSVEVSGTWKYRGTFYRDRLVRLTVDAPKPKEASRFFRAYKKVLKSRFEQVDIWITAHDVDVI